MTTAILTLNAGSSTLKFALFEPGANSNLPRLYSGLIEQDGANNINLCLKNASGDMLHQQTLNATKLSPELALDCIDSVLPHIQISIISHRLVHGGQQFFEATLISADTIKQLQELIPLAPLHLPAEIKAIETLVKRLPTTPQVACFDTAFHRDQLALSKLLPLPRCLREQGLIRYGFHGLSYEYIASQLSEKHGLTVVAHLGSGASACAINCGKSVTHSMGFSTNEGLMMSTRSGSIDPGVILYLLEEKNVSITDMHALLFDQSGLLGVSGISADIRQLESNPDPKAQEAIDFFCYRAAAEIGKLLPALGGINTLVFTAGIGGNSAQVRQGICQYFTWLGVELDLDANENSMHRISLPHSQVEVLVIPTDEELMLAKNALPFL